MNEVGNLKQFIFEIRGQQVMLDSDLASMYGIEVRALNQAAKRNPERFPEDFMFQLNQEEFENLKFQNGTSSWDSNLKSQFVTSSWGGVRKLPYAFTEHGVLMLSSVLRSPNAIQVNINIMRTFTAMRKYFAENKSVALDIRRIEKTLLAHIDTTDEQLVKHTNSINNIIEILDEMRKLPEPPPKRKIGFGVN